MDEAEHQVRRTLNAYCESIDGAEFERFAGLFERGHWFMVDAPGPEPVLAWLRQNIVLHDGRTLTRHEMSNLDVEVHDDGAAHFRCYIAIWQHLPGSAPQLLAHARFGGTFERQDGRWWWTTHTMTPDWIGDVSEHVRGFGT